MGYIFDFFSNNFIGILVLIVTYFFGFITSYLKERVKNKAILADIKKLENEKELIRKSHQLDLEKRKYKYESKREQFTKYFNLIDSFSSQSNTEIRIKFLPMISTYFKEYLSGAGNKQDELNAISKFSDGINSFMVDANNNLIRLRSETNSIKIIAGQQTLKHLEDMDKLYDQLFDLTSQMVKHLINYVITQDEKSIADIQMQYSYLTEKIIRNKELMIEEIRKELDEI